MEQQQLLALDTRDLQFFAEGGEAGAPEGGGNDGVGIDPIEGSGAEDMNPTFEAPKTQSELDSIISKSNQKTLENYKKGEAQRIQDAITEVLKKEKDYPQLSEEGRAQREFEDSKKAFEAEKSEFEYEKLVVQVQRDLVSKGLPSEFAELFALDNAENSLKEVGEFEAVFNQAVAEVIKISLCQKAPGIGVGGINQSNYDASLAQNASASGQKLFQGGHNISKTFFGNAEILHNTPYEVISILVDKATAGTVAENGHKVLKAGAILSGDDASIFDDRTKKVRAETNPSGTTCVDGILLYDVDVTDKGAIASLVYRGTLREDKIGAGTVDANVKARLLHIQFVKGA